MKLYRWCLALVVSFAITARAEQSTCVKCHDDPSHTAQFETSVHADLECTACHTTDSTRAAPSNDGQTCDAAFVTTNCASCHSKQASEHQASVHNSKRLPVSCTGCHADLHTIKPHTGDKLRIAQTCSGCHDRQKGYFESSHFEAIQLGSTDAATCTDCHGAHSVKAVDNDTGGRALHTRACLACHDDHEKMRRNKVTLICAFRRIVIARSDAS